MIGHKRIRIASEKVEEGSLTYPLSGPNSKAQGWTDIRAVDIPLEAVLRTELVTAKGKTASEILADLVKQHGGNWLVFNASYFASDGALLGKTYKDGKTIFNDVVGKTEQRPHLYYKDGRFDIGRISSPADVKFAVCGVPTLTANGKAIDPPAAAEKTPSDVPGNNPRTIAGIKADGTLGLILVDGRGNYDKGLTSKEAGIMAAHYGYVESVNLDGGWSTSFATNNRQLLDMMEIDKANRKRQYHVSDMSRNYKERVIHHAVAIQIDSDKLFGKEVVPELIIDAGHGGNDPGASGNDIIEKQLVLDISLYQFNRFKELGVPVSLTRNSDKTLEPNQRSAIVKNSGAKYCISNHINAADSTTAGGAELIHSVHSNGAWAKTMADSLKAAGQVLRPKSTYARTANAGQDYYFMHRQTGAVETVIVEYGFLTNSTDARRLKDNWQQYAEAIVKAYCLYVGHKYVLPTLNKPVPSKSLGNDRITINVNGNPLPTKGVLINGVTFAPVRELTNALGGKVIGGNKNNTVNVSK